jgi:hypothetical protein
MLTFRTIYIPLFRVTNLLFCVQDLATPDLPHNQKISNKLQNNNEMTKTFKTGASNPSWSLGSSSTFLKIWGAICQKRKAKIPVTL